MTNLSPVHNQTNPFKVDPLEPDDGESSSGLEPEVPLLPGEEKKTKSKRVKVPKALPIKGDGSKGKKKPAASSEVIQWLVSLCLPQVLTEKYIALFAEEEVFYMSQILSLKEHHLHEWMGVRTGTVLVMLESIKKIKDQPEYLQVISQIAIPSYVSSKEKEKEEAEKREKEKEKEIRDKEKEKEREQKEKEKEIRDKEREKEKEQKNLEKMNEKIESKEKKGEVYQAGGHGGVFITAPGEVRKKTVAAEIAFYKEFQTLSLDKIPEHIRTFFPTLVSASKKSIIMKDLTYGNSKPCIMDVKMGTRTAGENANKIKKNFMISKDKATTTASYGLRIVAARTFNNNKGVWQALSRGDCNSIADHTSLEIALGSFFLTGNEQPRLDVVDYFIGRMEILKEWMEKQTSFRFYSSSLLFVYDGDDKSPFRADVRMIDFAHVHEIVDGGIDEGYLKGLTNLLNFFKRYKKDCIKKTFKVIPDKSMYHVENPEESEYFEMRPNINHPDTEESDEEFFGGERDREKGSQASTPSGVSTPISTPITAMKVSKDSGNSHSYSPTISTVPLYSSGGIQPTIIPAKATVEPKPERTEKKKTGKGSIEMQRDADKFEREKRGSEGIRPDVAVGEAGGEKEEETHPTPRDSTGKDAMAATLVEIAKMAKKERTASNAIGGAEGSRDAQDEAVSPKHLGQQGSSKSSKQMKVSTVAEESSEKVVEPLGKDDSRKKQKSKDKEKSG